MPFAAASAMAGIALITATAPVTNTASTSTAATSPASMQTRASTKKSTAMMRNVVNARGRGASSPINTTSHADHRSTAATTCDAPDHSPDVSAAAGPAVTGNVTQSTRSNQI